MKIRTQIIISIIVSVVVIAITGTMLFFNYQQLEVATENEQIADDIVQGAYALSNLQNDYLRHNSDRARLQWEDKYDTLQDQFSRIRITDPVQLTTLDTILDSNQQLRDIFLRIVASRETTGSAYGAPADPELVGIRWNRLDVQTQGMIFDASRLSELVKEDVSRIQRENNWLIVILISVLLLVILLNYSIVNRRILGSITYLSEGAKIIGSGDLDHRIPENSKDEIGELSHAFNQMSGNLKEITASKNDLEQEVAERRKAEEALRTSEGRYRALFEETLDGICLADAKTGIIIDCNKAMSALVGRERAELIGQPQTILHPPENDHSAFSPTSRQHLTEKEGQILESLVVTKTGIIREVEIKANLLNIQGQELLQGIFRDITDRKHAEEALKKYSEKLEEMVSERTRELHEAQDQLVIKEKLAVLGKLAGVVGHELRNPLGTIKNAAYFLDIALENPDPDVKEMVALINKAVIQSEDIISSLLDFARPKVLTLRKVSVGTVVDEALKRNQVPDHVTVVINHFETLPQIQADPDKLFQAFSNIISNAFQAMQEGGKLTISANQPAPEWVSVAFKDTGVGISPEHMKRIYEPLFTTKTKGIGLGLVATKSIVEAHGGHIDVRSELGEGTTFTVNLPMTGRKEA